MRKRTRRLTLLAAVLGLAAAAWCWGCGGSGGSGGGSDGSGGSEKSHYPKCPKAESGPGTGPIISVKPKLASGLNALWKVEDAELDSTTQGNSGYLDVRGVGQIVRFDGLDQDGTTRELKRLDLTLDHDGTPNTIAIVADPFDDPWQLFWLMNNSQLDYCDGVAGPPWPDCYHLGLPPELIGIARDASAVDLDGTTWSATDSNSDGTKDSWKFKTITIKARR